MKFWLALSYCTDAFVCHQGPKQSPFVVLFVIRRAQLYQVHQNQGVAGGVVILTKAEMGICLEFFQKILWILNQEIFLARRTDFGP